MKYLVIGIFMFVSVALSAQNQTVGLFVNEEESLNGYTLFTNSRTTFLIDNCGFEVNSWQSNASPGLAVYLLDDGSLLRCNRVSGDFGGGGAGGGFERQSWDGITTWRSDLSDQTGQSHHDIAVLPNGNFLTLVWTPLSGAKAQEMGRTYDTDMWIEKIYEIKMIDTEDLEIVWEWSLSDHIIQDESPDKPNYGIVSENPGKMDFNYIPSDQGLDPDWAHFNAIAYNAELDQIAVSSRDFSEIWILDHSTTTEEARTSQGGNSGKGGDILYRYGNPQVYDRGNSDDQVFFNQHNIEWIPSGYPNGGSLSVFNNNWEPGKSRVERWTPPVDGYNYQLNDVDPYGPVDIDWSYDEPGFYSARISGVQFLSNGNALICSGGQGRFFEVSEDGELLWDYINPIRSNNMPIMQGQMAFQNSTFRALRYPADFIGFEGKDLTPSEQLEINPIDSDCVVTNTEEIIINEEKPITQVRMIDNHNAEIVVDKAGTVRLTHISGSSSFYDLSVGLNTVDLSGFPSGMYFLTMDKTTIKFVKI